MARSMDGPIEVPPEHRKRRHDAWIRAARAHQRAAAAHEAAAAFMDAHDKPEKAAEHERAADVDRQLASEAYMAAQEYLEAPSHDQH